MTTIFFLGVGHMGGGMAANLAKASFGVLAYDISDDNLARAVANGCRAVESTAAGAVAADVVMTSAWADADLVGRSDGRRSAPERATRTVDRPIDQ